MISQGNFIRGTSAILALALAMSAAAASPGAKAAAAEPPGYWTGDINSPVPTTVRGGAVIHTKALAALLARGGSLVVDVSNSPRRPDLAPGAPWLPLPHQAIPGALWIPGAGEGNVAAEVEAFYKSRLAEAAQGNLDAPLIVYCHKSCWLSWNAAKRAVNYGYRHVYWYPDGIEGWTATGQPTAVAEPQEPRAAPGLPQGEPPRAGAKPKLAILDIELSGDLGGPDFTAEHDARLKLESERLREDLRRTGLYDVVDNGPAQQTIDTLKAQQAFLHDCNGCDLDVGRQLHADLVLVAWVNRVSGLILTLTYEIHDVNTSQIASRKSYDFRGDNDSAWNHAIDYMVRDLKASQT